ncbi:hypothetical protein A3I57_01205 [Candidatus Beckwithbacteria bacterium RIFCSPLOWO2_02_FULL_47_23]|uniref:Phage holin family protein n=2 Tax=Candidatus Beckwithiibacteriota TaxID=1752726 RepID=A0A1F5DZW5_9BACT|nr:MAG: hypothetical protein A3I57_01205 [Candidatus Beckwithbacteria bacterium RIFCSPLOWO2_02_FULL_47_23]
MRDWLRQGLLNSFSLYLVAAVYPGLIIPKTLWQLLWVGVTFTLLNYLAKPLIKLILLPLNLLTLGLLSWLSGVLVLVIAVRLLPTLQVVPALIPAWQQSGFSVPALSLNLWLSFILTSLSLSLVYKLLDGILCPD